MGSFEKSRKSPLIKTNTLKRLTFSKVIMDESRMTFNKLNGLNGQKMDFIQFRRICWKTTTRQ